MADVMDNVVKMLRQYFKVEINDILAAILVILENDDMGKALNLLRQIVDPLPQDIKDPVDFVQQKFQYLFNTHIISGGHLNSTSKDGHKIDPIKARQTFRPNSDAPFSSTGSLKSKEATKESNKKNERDFKPGDGNKSNTLEKVESDSSDSSDTSSSSLNHVSPAQLLANQILSSSKLGSTFSPKSTIPKSDTTKVKTSLQNVKSLKTNDKSLSVENSTINIPNIETTVSADRPKLVAKKVEPNSVSTSVLQETIPSKSEDSDSSSDSSEDEETQKVQTKASGLNNLDKKAPIHQKPQTGNDPKHQEKKNSKPSSALKKGSAKAEPSRKVKAKSDRTDLADSKTAVSKRDEKQNNQRKALTKVMKSKDKLIAKGSIVVKKNDTESSSSSSDSDLKDVGLKTNQFLNKPETSIYKNVPLDNKIDFSGQNQSIENLKVPNKKMISNSSSDSDSSSEEENADINKSVSLTGDALKTNACKGVIGSSTVQNLSNSVKSAMTPQKSKDQKTPGKSSSQKLTAPSTGVTTPKSKFATSAALGSTKNLDASSTSDDSSDSDTDSDDRKGKNSNFDADLNKITTKKNPNLSFKATNVSNLSQTPDKPSTILKSKKETPPIIPQLPVNTKESDSSDSDSSSDPKRIKTVIKTFKPADSKPASKTAVNKIASNSFVASQNKKSEPGKSTTLAASSKSLQESVDVSSDSDSSSDTQDGENGKPSPIVQSKKTPTAFKTPASASKLAENKKAEVVPDKKSKISKNSKISKSVSVPQKNSKKLINQPEGDPAPAPQKSQSVLFDTSTGSEDDSKSIGIGESDKKGSVPSKKFKPSVKGGKTEIGAKGQVSVSKTKPLPPGVAVNNEVLGSSSSDSSDEGSEGDQVNNRESNISKSSKTEPTKLEKSSNKTNQDVLTNGGDDTSAIGKPKKRKKGADDTATQDFEPKTDKPSFRRINNNINELPEELRTNEFQPTTSNASGIHASKAFKNVQGKDFKREKGKRKRGSFTLGTIDTSARSFKFNDNE